MSFTAADLFKLATLLVVVSPVLGGPTTSDERHPRAPDQALAIDFTPYYCTKCQKLGMIEGEPRDVDVMRSAPETVARKSGVRRNWIVIESPNFKIFSTLKGTPIKHGDSRFAAADLLRLKKIFPKFGVGGGQTNVTAHQRAHLYQIRMERIYAHFAALVNNKKRWLGMNGKFQAFLFESEKHYRAFSEELLGRKAGTDKIQQDHLKGADNFQVMAAGAKLFKRGDRELHNSVVHILAHMLVNGHRNYYTDVWGWLEEGAAHYYERRESTLHNHFCLPAGAKLPAAWMKSNWPKKVKSMVRKRKETSLGGWCEKIQPRQLAEPEHALAWSIVKWLIEVDPVRFGKLMDESADWKNKPNCAKSVENVFGESPDVLHERWRRWVMKGHAG